MQPNQDKQALKDQWHYSLDSHVPTEEAKRKMSGLRSAAKAMADAVIDMTPPGRDQALALTNIEQMLFHANAAIARSENVENQPADDKPEEDKHLEPAVPNAPRKD